MILSLNELLGMSTQSAIHERDVQEHVDEIFQVCS